MPSTSNPPAVPSLAEQLVRESCSMARRLAATGSRVPPSVLRATDEFERTLAAKKPIDVAALAATHDRLARLVAPAKPGTLYLLDENFHQRGVAASSLGPVRLVRQLVRVAMVCVAIFIILSVVALVDAHSKIDLFSVDDVAGRRGRALGDDHTLMIIKIILERVFWLAAAGIGASFAMLFQLNDQIVTRTFDPDESASYWVKFFLGLVAGFILVALVPIGPQDAGSQGAGGAASSAQALGPPTIALLGGFSASAVYRVLTKMVEALESIFSGGPKETLQAMEKATAARASEESAQLRMAVAGHLVDLQQKLSNGASSEEAAARLRQIVARLVPSGGDTGLTGSADAAPAGSPTPAAADKVPAFAVVSAPEAAPAAPAEAYSAPAPEDVGPPADAYATADAAPAEDPQYQGAPGAVG